MKSHIHDSATLHVTGESTYVDDRPYQQGEVFVDIFYSPIARGKILSIDLEKAQSLKGVLAFYTAKDLSHNRWGNIMHDQPFLAEDNVQYVGEPIVIIAAKNPAIAREARNLITIKFEELEATLDLQAAIDQRNYIGPVRTIERGQIEQSLKSSKHILKNFIEMAGQDHFYLESQASIAYPKEDGQIEIHSSSQHPTEVQHLVAEALGKKYHQVVCIVKRMGGAFGGKESQAAPFAVFASLVADRLKKPARVILTKDDDMIMTGKRNPFKNFYEVGFDENGKILALNAKLYSDGGAYADLSTAIMERAMLHLDNAYNIENFKVTGQVCRTNTTPNTAFRGFGGPKGVLTIESIIEDIAKFLGKDSLEIRKVNTYQKGDTTPYGQVIEDNILPELFEQIEKETNYQKWKKDIDNHNQSDETTIKGLSVTAVKFGISFTTRFLNQGNALVNIHLDGTIQVSTGATEMGQGVNTKIAAVVCESFGLPIENVRIMPTSTEKNPNTSATAASSGSDINASAALCAAKTLRENLAKTAKVVLSRSDELRGWKVAGTGNIEEIDITNVKDIETIQFENGYVFDSQNPDNKIAFHELVQEAYLNRIQLTAQGFFRYPGIFYDKETGKGTPFFYFTNGVAASEVSIDKFTGEMKVNRTEILMDLGRPINEAIDRGQVMGAFIQGLGWVSLEKLHYHNGKLLSHSPSTYKIPSIHDIPREFKVKLINNSLNLKNVKASKAVGEPPLLLAISVWCAIKNALNSLTKKPVHISLPATGELIFHKIHESEE